MPDVRISVFLLLTLILFSFGSSLFVCGSLDTMEKAAEQLPPRPERTSAQTVEIITEEWKRIFPFLRRICGYQELLRMDDAVLELRGAFFAGEEAVYRSALEKLFCALGRLRSLQSFSFSAVF